MRKQFTLKDALETKHHKIETRDGNEVKIYDTNFNPGAPYKIAGKVIFSDGSEKQQTWQINGLATSCGEDSDDLFIVYPDRYKAVKGTRDWNVRHTDGRVSGFILKMDVSEECANAIAETLNNTQIPELRGCTYTPD